MATTASRQKLFADPTYSFVDSKATKKLRELAEHPFDLAKLSPERIKEMVATGCGLKLLYGTQRVTPEILAALGELATQAHALEKMEAMQSGEMVNFIAGFDSENRQVLHTAMRDFFPHPNPSPEAAKAAKAARVEFEKLEQFLADTEQFTDMVCIGIGGSELGPKMLYQAMSAYRQKGRRVHFISNIDPDDLTQVMAQVDLKTTLVVSISKSGGTLETKTNEDMVRARYEKAGLRAARHFVCITGKGSPMDDPSLYRASFYIWDYVGGRYCGTSMVGGVPLAFAYGLENYEELLRGANEMDRLALKPTLFENLPLLHALLGIWNRDFLGYPTLAIIPYAAVLSRFSAHIQQLDMESNGKHIDRNGHHIGYKTGPVIWGEPGTNAQHSFFQLIHQGTDVIPLELIGFKESQFGQDMQVQGTTSQQKLLANMMAQALALATGQVSSNPNKEFVGNRPSTMILGEQLDPYALGSLLALYEHKVAFQGFIWNINSFDQEGVQLGKVVANKIIHRFASKKGEPYPLADALIDQLNRW